MARKACGLNGIAAEMLEAGDQDMVHFLTRVFNILFIRVFINRSGPRQLLLLLIKKETKNR